MTNDKYTLTGAQSRLNSTSERNLLRVIEIITNEFRKLIPDDKLYLATFHGKTNTLFIYYKHKHHYSDPIKFRFEEVNVQPFPLDKFDMVRIGKMETVITFTAYLNRKELLHVAKKR